MCTKIFLLSYTYNIYVVCVWCVQYAHIRFNVNTFSANIIENYTFRYLQLLFCFHSECWILQPPKRQFEFQTISVFQRNKQPRKIEWRKNDEKQQKLMLVLCDCVTIFWFCIYGYLPLPFPWKVLCLVYSVQWIFNE